LLDLAHRQAVALGHRPKHRRNVAGERVDQFTPRWVCVSKAFKERHNRAMWIAVDAAAVAFN